MMECIAIVGFILTIFVTGVSVGKFVEKIERFIGRKEDEKGPKHKNNRR